MSSPSAGIHSPRLDSIFRSAAPGAPRDDAGPSLLRSCKGRAEKVESPLTDSYGWAGWTPFLARKAMPED